MGAQDFHARRRKGHRRQAAETGMRGRIHEKHLLSHQLGDRAQFCQSHCGKLFRRRRALRGKVVQHRDHIFVSGHYPGVQIRIPMHRRFGSQAPVQRIRISKHFRIEKVIEAERRSCGRRRCLHIGAQKFIFHFSFDISHLPFTELACSCALV